VSGAQENVVIRSGDCSVTLLPKLGGKIASIRVGSHELLQAPLHPCAPRTPTMSFAQSDASGWDECLPSVAACTLLTEAGPASIPDHGDLWRIPWQILEATRDSATLRVDGFSLPLQLTRTILLVETPTGWRLQLLYSLANRGACNIPWSWSAHPLFAVERGDRILLPEPVHGLRLEGSAGSRLGSHGDAVRWPLAHLADGSTYDLSIAGCADCGIGDKLFAGPINPADQAQAGRSLSGWAALERSAIGLRLTVRFDPAITPYLGLWLCYGGWPDGPGPRQHCVALEPSTAPTDALSTTGSWSRRLAPGESVNWPMELNIDRVATAQNLRAQNLLAQNKEPQP